MDTNTLITIIEDQNEELLSKDMSESLPRAEMNLLSMKSKRAQVVIGVRRSGKSTLCEMFLKQQKTTFAYINFDDERLYNLQTENLNQILEAFYFLYGDIDCFFFDEIQNIDGWPFFVNRLLRTGKHIILIGSNSKLLSNELITHLTGRYHKIELYPFSFKEYATIRQVDMKSRSTKALALRKRALVDYLHVGGFPELLYEEKRKEYVDGLFHTIIRNDIARRFSVRNVDVLKKMATYLADNFAHEFVSTNLGKMFGISNHTANNYYSYLKEAFLFVGINKFSYKSSERIRNEKCYVIDVAFANDREGSIATENLGWRLENVVCIELLRRYRSLNMDIFYYKERGFEIDFVVTKGSAVQELIQVSYDIHNEKTRQREIKGLLQASEKLKCPNLTLITFDQSETIALEDKVIHILPADQWLVT